MPTKNLTTFEVLCTPIAPGVPNVPSVQQGFFLQISNLGAASALVSVEYHSSPAFVDKKGAIKLFTNIIDQSGTPQQYPVAAFLSAPVGYEALTIPAGATWLVGVQYLLLPPPPPILTVATGATPQDAQEARGMVKMTAAAGTKLMVLATVRQVFTNYSPTGTLLDISEGAYSVPLAGGPELHF
jgi:hypothetical protein